MANSQYNFLDYAGLALFWSKVKNIIEDNELVTATALTNLDTRVDTVEDALANQIISITYTNLRTLKNSGQLVPGQQYRITDYNCSTSQIGTAPAGHVFDIIVTADSNNKLNEEARAALHTGDTYFKDCNLSAWKIWYCIDNDTTRFAWADNGALGKGVIYRMIDEFGNDCPYDFKNIQFYRVWDQNKSLLSNIPNSNAGVLCYTFSSEASSSTTSVTDMSLGASNAIYSNVIKEYVNNNNDKKRTLNNICFFGISCHGNIFENDCYHNTFGHSCSSNYFGNNCYKNTLGSSCCNNTLGDICFSNTFGNQCVHMSFGNNCYGNTFGNQCTGNTVGSGCNNNHFGDRWEFNNFGNGCTNISATRKNDDGSKMGGDYYTHNHFGDGCQYIVFTDEGITSPITYVQNYNFGQGTGGTSYNVKTYKVERGQSFETRVLSSNSVTKYI